MRELSLDWETRSDVDLIKEGVYRYVESQHTDVLLASYRFSDETVIRRWRKGEPCPADIREHVERGGIINAHNAAFERLIWWFVMSDRHDWPRPKLEQFRCTAVAAAASSLPRALGRLGDALDLKVKKDKRGTFLIKKLSVPAGWKNGAPVWSEDSQLTAEFHDYCDDDVRTECEASSRIVPISDYEQRVYALNETINDRGLRIDVVSARAAVQIADKAKEALNKELTQVTGGYVTAVTQAAALKRWVEQQGIVTENLDKDTIDDLLHSDDLPDRIRRALELRQEGGKPSVEKIAAMLSRVNRDGRVRGVYLHHGAGQTGRFSSRGVQAHNLPKTRKIFEAESPRFDVLFKAIRTGEPDALTWLYGEELGRPLHLLSDAIRLFIWAAPGYDLIDADYSSIEGRMAAWFAGEDWKLDAFRALDRGDGPGMYELTAASIYNIDVADVSRAQRGVGKVGELSMGYQGGVGALAKMARQNKLKLHTVFGSVWESATPERREAAEKRFAERANAHDEATEKLGREGWLAAELIKVGWRAAHPRIAESWRLLESAATDAVLDPGSLHSAVGAKFRVVNGFLWMQLPSGRCLAYGRPRIGEVIAPWADKTLPLAKQERKIGLTALGVDAVTDRWTRHSIYGGSLFNNLVQGSARDIMVHGMFAAEAAGYPIVLHTHDEMAAEVPVGFGSVEEFSAIINRLPEWARGLPLAAAGWRGKRYRKD